MVCQLSCAYFHIIIINDDDSFKIKLYNNLLYVSHRHTLTNDDDDDGTRTENNKEIIIFG